MSTRAVSAAAGVQAPTLHWQFGDMRGLLDAVALETLAEYVRQKRTRVPSADPLEDLPDWRARGVNPPGPTTDISGIHVISSFSG